MKRIVVLGNSLAGIKALEEIQVVDPQAECLMVSLDGNYPYYPDRLYQYLAKDISASELWYKPQKYYEENNIQIVLDKRIEKINFKKNSLATDQKEIIGYDVLIITQTPDQKFPDIKGTNKRGVFNFHRLSDVEEISKELTFADAAVIESASWAGFKAAYAMRQRGKEVLLLASNPVVVSQLAEESAQLMIQNLQEQGIRVLLDNAIAEVLGDGDVKAVRLKSGKVMAADMVLFDNVLPHLKIFNDTPLKVGQRICVNAFFRTNIENVYAVDEMCDPSRADNANKGWSVEDLLEQGRIVAAAIHGREILFTAGSVSERANIIKLCTTISNNFKRTKRPA